VVADRSSGRFTSLCVLDPIPSPCSAVLMFIAPFAPDTGLSKSKLPCFVRFTFTFATCVCACTTDSLLLLLCPLPPLAVFAMGTALPCNTAARETRSRSLTIGDPTRLGLVISLSLSFPFRLSMSSLDLSAEPWAAARCLSFCLSLSLSDTRSLSFSRTRSLSFPFSLTGVSLGGVSPHNGEHRPGSETSSISLCPYSY
jgi:hypothetical protein